MADRGAPDAYAGVAGQAWDLVVDVARQPGQVRGAVEALADRAGHWVFVSSGNVYADHGVVGADESAPLLPPLDGDVMTDMSVYGEAKVACERLVTDALGPDRSLLARVGLIGGPGDVFDRTGYWPSRFAPPRPRPTAPCWCRTMRTCRSRSSTSVTSRPGCSTPAPVASPARTTWSARTSAWPSTSTSPGGWPATPDRCGARRRPGCWSRGSSRGWVRGPCRSGCPTRGGGLQRPRRWPGARGRARARPLEQTLADTLAWDAIDQRTASGAPA